MEGPTSPRERQFPVTRIRTTDSLKSPQVLLIQLLTRRERSVTGAFLRLIPADQSLSECYSHVDLEVWGTLPVYDASRIEAQTL